MRVGPPDLFDPPDCDEVHVSVAFTWDRDLAEKIAELWGKVHGNVKLGGPALGDRGDAFVPGRYLGPGHVITSRGCPNRCWFCDVPKREGGIRELPIEDGWMVHDANFLACSEGHCRSVFDMLDQQPYRARFVGGLEPARLREWHCEELRRIRTDSIFCAYDTPDDLGPLRKAGQQLSAVGFTRHHLYCYVLCGFRGDTMAAAEERLRVTYEAGFMPFAMVYMDTAGERSTEWHHWQRSWCRPALVRKMLRKGNNGQ